MCAYAQPFHSIPQSFQSIRQSTLGSRRPLKNKLPQATQREG